MTDETSIANVIARVPMFESIAALPPGMTLGNAVDIVLMVQEWAKARNALRLITFGHLHIVPDHYGKAIRALEKRMAVAVGIPGAGDGDQMEFRE